jgi:hypothetical protein
MDWATVVVTDGRVLTKRMQRQILLHKRPLVRDGFGFNMPLDRREFFVRLLPARTGHPTPAIHCREAVTQDTVTRHRSAAGNSRLRSLL